MEYVYITLLLTLNVLWLFLVVIGLPGTWLMVLSAAGLAWWQPELGLFSRWTLVAVAVLAALGEVLEFASGAAGSRKAGGSIAGTVGALFGALAGGLFGTVLIPVPVVGSILGACLGAFGGAVGGDLLSGRDFDRSIRSGQGAAVGRFYGILGKLAVGVAIWFTLAVAAFVG